MANVGWIELIAFNTSIDEWPSKWFLEARSLHRVLHSCSSNFGVSNNEVIPCFINNFFLNFIITVLLFFLYKTVLLRSYKKQKTNSTCTKYSVIQLQGWSQLMWLFVKVAHVAARSLHLVCCSTETKSVLSTCTRIVSASFSWTSIWPDFLSLTTLSSMPEMVRRLA